MATSFTLRPLAETVDLVYLRAAFEANTTRPKRDALDLEAAKALVRRQLADVIGASLYPVFNAELRDGLAEVFDEHDLRFGERPPGKGNGQTVWDEVLSEAVERYFGPNIANICGEGWIGEMVIGPRLDQQQVRERIASDAARRLATQLAELTTVEAIGLAQDDIEAMARLRLPVPKAAPAPPEEGDPDEAVRLLAAHIEMLRDLGRIVDEAEWVPELELIGDYDAVLTPGAMRRLGLDTGIEPHMAAYREFRGDGWATKLFREAQEPPQEVAAPVVPLEAQSEPAPVPVPQDPVDRWVEGIRANAVPPPEPKKRGRPFRTPGRPSTHERVTNLQRAAFLLSAHGGTAGRDLAAHVGITQSDWSRIINSRLAPTFDSDQIGKLIRAAESHITGLQDAIQRMQAALK